jgi:twinkle protein
VNLIEEKFNWQEYDELPERSKVIPASNLADEVVDLFYGTKEAKGAYLPWEKAADKFRVRRREVTLYAGINGHGKSLVTSQIALGLMRQGEPTLLCSFEMRPSASMQRMTRQAAVTGEPSIPYIRAFHKWTDSRLWIYDHFGTCRPEKALAVCQYAAREFGVKQFVVDSLMKCVAGTDDYTGQKLFVADLGTLAAAYDGHVHLVAHARKGQHEGDTLDKFDIKGAGEISDQVDNVVIVQRNKRKEKLREDGKDIVDNDPDAFFTICKQRHGAYEGTLGLWYDAPSGCYVERPNGSAKPLNLQLPAREPGED